jgi:hypothetical protein
MHFLATYRHNPSSGCQEPYYRLKETYRESHSSFLIQMKFGLCNKKTLSLQLTIKNDDYNQCINASSNAWSTFHLPCAD